MAKAKAPVAPVAKEKEVPIYVKTGDVTSFTNKETGVTTICLSEQLQKAGIPVCCVTGGTLNDKKTHYFKTTLKAVQALVGRDKKPLFTATDLELLIEVDVITPSNVEDSGLKGVLNQSIVQAAGESATVLGITQNPVK